VTTYWRVYSRFGLLVCFALAILAALALTTIGRRGGRAWLLPAAALLLVAVEFLPGNVGALAANARPAWVRWLAVHPRGIVATYPLPLGPAPALDLLREDNWYEQFDRDPRFAIYTGSLTISRSRDQAIRILANDPGDLLAARVLATEGVRYVVVHDDVYRADGNRVPALDPQRYRLLARFGDVAIYAVSAPRIDIATALRGHAREIAQFEGFAPPSIDYASGFNPDEPYQSSTGRWMIEDGAVELENGGDPERVLLNAVVFANAEARVLEVRDGSGRLVARRAVGTSAARITIGPFEVPHGTTKLTLEATPGPVEISGTDRREASIFLTYVGLVPLPPYAG
jgi:hypothetical protein